MRRSGISCLTPWIRRRLHGLGVADGVLVGDAIKSWDVLKTANFIKDRLSRETPVLDIGAYSSEILPVLHRMKHSNLTGVDLNPRIKEMPFADSIRYEVADFMATPFPIRRSDPLQRSPSSSTAFEASDSCKRFSAFCGRGGTSSPPSTTGRKKWTQPVSTSSAWIGESSRRGSARLHRGSACVRAFVLR